MTILLPLIGGGIGYLIKQSIENKKALLTEVAKERRQLYQKFVDLMIELLTNAKDGHVSSKKEQNLLYDFYKKYVLYASPRVINSFSDYFHMLYAAERNNTFEYKKHILKLSRIMYEMRRDLGLANKGLGNDGERILRALLKDYDSFMR